jgi:hypothetical protein
MNQNKAKILEDYSLKHPHEVLIVNVKTGEDEDQILIYKGFSSSLINPTPPDPDLPVLSDQAEIVSIDRLKNPYNPQEPNYIQQGLTWDVFLQLSS